MTHMTQAEKEAFLADLHVGIIALSDGENGPLTVPIWYDYEPGGDLWVLTGPNSRKGKLLLLGTPRMGTKARGVSFIANISNEQTMMGKA